MSVVEVPDPVWSRCESTAAKWLHDTFGGRHHWADERALTRLLVEVYSEGRADEKFEVVRLIGGALRGSK
jgi:hypothetical protein